jgi:RiboL-PSP-HEPN
MGDLMPSKARLALTENLKDVDSLLELHAEKGGTKPGRKYGLEVLNKSAIILITASWEAYCEDIAAEALAVIVAHAKHADALPEDIKKIVAKELKADQHDLAIWKISDDKWRALLSGRLTKLQEDRNRKLNTPKSENIDQLFVSAIGLPNVSDTWVWAKKLTAAKARKKLEKFVELRGAIAHRGHAIVSVKKAQVVDYRNFIKHAAARTGGAVNAHVKKITDQSLF